MALTRGLTSIDGTFATTTDLINYAGSMPTGKIITTNGFTTSGDGGGAKWKGTGNTITASQTPAQTGNATCSDANGNEFELVLNGSAVDVRSVGVILDGVTDNQLSMAALTASSGHFIIPIGFEMLCNAAILAKSNTIIEGGGKWVSTALSSGGSGIGMRQIGLESVDNVIIRDIIFESQNISTFSSGMRSIGCINSSNYDVSGCTFATQGAAVASINCTDYNISSNKITISGVSRHDGVIDNWSNSSRFAIVGNDIDCAGIGQYGILVTGSETDGTTAATSSNFTITGNSVRNAEQVGIWVNGRDGINNNFVVSGNLIDLVTMFQGISITDSNDWAVSSNIVRSAATSGIKAGKEGAFANSCRRGVISSNVVIDANTTSSAGEGGSAIGIFDSCDRITASGNVVTGSTHTYSVFLKSTTTNCEVIGQNYTAGTSGTILNTVVSNKTPAQQLYTPTITNESNVAANSHKITAWYWDGDRIRASGRIDITPTSTGLTSLEMSIPIASNFVFDSDATGMTSSDVGDSGGIVAMPTTDTLRLRYTATTTSLTAIHFNYTYTIK